MSEEYILGTNETEFDRLKFQHSVWGDISRDLFSRLNISKGMKCLDVGAGPGFASFDIRKIIGDGGELTVLEPSGEYINHIRMVASENKWDNINYINGVVVENMLSDNYYDFIFVRWVIAFLEKPFEFLKILIKSLSKNGIIAIQDYAGEGPNIYPEGGAFDNVYETVKKYWAYGGGDLYIGKKLPQMFDDAGLQIVDLKPNCIAGRPDSGIFKWADKFFTAHIPKMVELGIITNEYGISVLEDWNNHKSNRNSVFFSPIVVDICGKKIL